MAFCNQLRLKGAVTITWRFNLDFAMITLETFTAFAVSAIAATAASGIMLVVSEMVIELGIQRRFNEIFTQCPR